jgi:60 kDa SS-A/Ro ribonucleoprotein
MNDIYKGYLASKNTTPQREQARPDQVRNYAGGYVFETKAETAVDRFLLLGTDKPTYYASAQTLTREAAGAVEAYAASPGNDLVERIVAISKAGRAPKNSPALLALAIAASVGDEDTQRKAFAVLPDVARTSTHLFEFVEYLDSMRGWGRAPRRAVAEWYTSKTPDSLAYQAVKYRQRNGWTHRDVLRLAHPTPVDNAQDDVLEWIVSTSMPSDRKTNLPKVIRGFERAHQVKTKTGDYAARLIEEYGLPWEALPDSVINTPEVWKALVPNMGMTALMRNLSRVARLDDHKAAREIESMMVERLRDPETVRRARLHPINILVAMRTYASGRSAVTGPYNAIARNFGGGSTWTPNRHVTDALDKAYYDSFQYQEPTGKRILYALDVSGSMAMVEAKPGLTPRDISAAMALATLAVEPNVDVVGFTDGSRGGGWRETHSLTPLDLSPRRRLDDNVREVSNLNFGRTDCALPAKWAAANRKDYDAIVIATDNETWAGNGHPFQALETYRKQVGHPVKQIVVAMTATDFSIADPKDPHSLDVVGFDSALPGLIAEFTK